MKKSLVLIVASLMILLFAATAGAETLESKVQLIIGDSQAKIDGEVVKMTAPAQIVNGSTLVPLRFVGEAFGCDVSWNGASQTAVVQLVDQVIQVPIGVNYAVINGEKTSVKVPAQIINGSTMVPLRFIGENLGAKVGYDNNTRTVSISLKVYINEQQDFQLVLPVGWTLDQEDVDGVYFVKGSSVFMVTLSDQGEGIDASNWEDFSNTYFKELAGKEILYQGVEDLTSVCIYVEGDRVTCEFLKLLDGGIYFMGVDTSKESFDDNLAAELDLIVNSLSTP